MTEHFPAFSPSDVDADLAELRRLVGDLLRAAGVLVEFRPHRAVVERHTGLAEGAGRVVSTVDIAAYTATPGAPPHVVLFDTGDQYAEPNMVAAVAQVRGRLDHGRWLWTTRAERRRVDGSVVTTLAVRDERQAVTLAVQEWAVVHPHRSLAPHRSPWSVLYTLAHSPGGEIHTRQGPGQDWTRETACLCDGDRPTGRPHYFGCPAGVPAEWSTPNGWLWRTVTGEPGVLWTYHRGDALALADVRRLYGELTAALPPVTPTPDDVRRAPAYWLTGPGVAVASTTLCPHGCWLTDTCSSCDSGQEPADECDGGDR